MRTIIGAERIQYSHLIILDHRGVNWDIPSTTLFESKQDNHAPLSQRGLQLDRPRTIEIYIPYLRHLYEYHKTLPRAGQLEKELLTTTTPSARVQLIAQFNLLDKERVRYMTCAEKKCKQVKQRQYAWSPATSEGGSRKGKNHRTPKRST